MDYSEINKLKYNRSEGTAMYSVSKISTGTRGRILVSTAGQMKQT